MSEIKVTEMTEATQINDNDLLMIVQNEKSKKEKFSTIKLDLKGIITEALEASY